MRYPSSISDEIITTVAPNPDTPPHHSSASVPASPPHSRKRPYTRSQGRIKDFSKRVKKGVNIFD